MEYNNIGEVRASGGAVIDAQSEPPRVLMIHRPRYGDWSMPKGKVRPGEDDAQAALREVAEETGLTCELGAALGTMHYRDRKGRPKAVRFWVMHPVAGQFMPSDEVDRCEWLAFDEAAERATRPTEKKLIALLAAAVLCRRGRVVSDDHGRMAVVEDAGTT